MPVVSGKRLLTVDRKIGITRLVRITYARNRSSMIGAGAGAAVCPYTYCTMVVRAEATLFYCRSVEIGVPSLFDHTLQICTGSTVVPVCIYRKIPKVKLSSSEGNGVMVRLPVYSFRCVLDTIFLF